MQTLSIGSCADPHYAVCRVSDLKIQLDPSYPNRLSQGISLVRDASYIQVGVLDTQLAPSALMYTTMVPTDAHSDWIVPRRASREAGVSIHLYLVRLNHDSVPCAYLAGMGVVAIRQLLHQSTLGPIAIRDERSRMVATVSFSVTEPLPPIPIEGPMPCVVPKGVSAWKSPLKAKPAPRTRFPALAQLLCDTTRTFLYAETPKWILAHQIETPLNQTPPEFWVAAVHAACAIASIPLDAFVRDPTQHAEVLGQVCSLVGGQTPYLADGSAVGTSFLMSDQWRILQQTPFLRSGDCEDSARSSYAAFESILALQGTASDAAELQSLLAVARHYCPFLVECAIQDKFRDDFAKTRTDCKDPETGNALCMHLFFKLVPWTLVATLIDPRFQDTVSQHIQPDAPKLSVLAVESTDRNITNWSDTRGHHDIRHLRDGISEWWQGAPTETKQSNLLCRLNYLVSPVQFNEERFYRFEVMYYSRRLFHATGQQVPYWFAVDSSTRAIGIPPIGLLGMYTSRDHCMLIPACVDSKAFKGLDEATLRCMPLLPPLPVPDTDAFQNQGKHMLIPEMEQLPQVGQPLATTSSCQ